MNYCPHRRLKKPIGAPFTNAALADDQMVRQKRAFKHGDMGYKASANFVVISESDNAGEYLTMKWHRLFVHLWAVRRHGQSGGNRSK